MCFLKLLLLRQPELKKGIRQEVICDSLIWKTVPAGWRASKTSTYLLCEKWIISVLSAQCLQGPFMSKSALRLTAQEPWSLDRHTKSESSLWSLIGSEKPPKYLRSFIWKRMQSTIQQPHSRSNWQIDLHSANLTVDLCSFVGPHGCIACVWVCYAYPLCVALVSSAPQVLFFIRWNHAFPPRLLILSS